MATSTKEDLQAHRFMNNRVRAALLDGDADAGERPLSRLGTGTYAGIFITVALLAVAGIFGVVRPGGSNAWQDAGALIVERETGARYVYLDGTLHPVLNYSSARLLLGNQLHVVSVSVRSLESAGHGPQVGITSAPDSLPDASHVAGSTWSVCAVGDVADGGPFRTAIFPGRSTDGDEVPEGKGYLLRTTAGRTFIVAHGHAFSIADRWLAALGYRGAPGIEVANDFVASLPPGEPIAPLPLPGLGEQGPPLPGSSDPIAVGTVFVDRLDGHYVMTRAGLTALTPLQADLLLADPDLAPAYSGNTPTAVPISQARITEAAPPPATRLRGGAQAPTTAPTPATLPLGDRQLCVRYPAEGLPDIVVADTDAPTPTAAGPVQLSTGGGALVMVRSDIGAPAAGQQAPRTTSAPGTVPGSATVLGATESVGCDSATGSPGAAGISTHAGSNSSPSPMICLVTDTGQRYPLAGPRALQQLGLAGVSVAQLPTAVIDLLPIGPVLDPAAAAAVAP